MFFLVLRDDELLLDTVGKIVWNERQGEEPVILPVPDATAPDPPPEGAFTVAGIVSNERGVAAADLRVEVWDRNVDGATLLAEGATDAGGRYSIGYDPALLKGKAGADLEIRVLDPRRDATELARSAVLYKAPSEAVSDLVVEARTVARTPEYDRLRDTIEPLLGDRPLERLDPEGVTYLAERSGWDARTVAMTAQATKLSESTGIAPQHYYALLRSGAPGTVDELHRMSDEQLVTVLKTAVAERLIADDGSIDATIERHGAEARRVLRDVRPAGAVSTLGDMLELTLDGAAQSTFIDVYRAVGEDQAALWPRLADAGFKDETITRLQTVGALGKLTLQNARVVGAPPARGRHRRARGPRHGGLPRSRALGEGDRRRRAGGRRARSLRRGAGGAGEPQRADARRRRPRAHRARSASTAPTRSRTSSRGPTARTSSASSRCKTWEGFAALSEEARGGAQLVERLYQISPSNDSMATLSAARDRLGAAGRELLARRVHGEVRRGLPEHDRGSRSCTARRARCHDDAEHGDDVPRPPRRPERLRADRAGRPRSPPRGRRTWS